MFENQSTALELDDASKDYLRTTVKWTAFLSIVGFIGLALSLIFALSLFTVGSQMNTLFEGNRQMEAFNKIGWVGLGIIYLVVILLNFYPVYALYKFSSLIKRGIVQNDSTMIREGFRYQRNLFMYLGVITLLILGFYLIMFVFGLILDSASSGM